MNANERRKAHRKSLKGGKQDKEGKWGKNTNGKGLMKVNSTRIKKGKRDMEGKRDEQGKQKIGRLTGKGGQMGKGSHTEQGRQTGGGSWKANGTRKEKEAIRIIWTLWSLPSTWSSKHHCQTYLTSEGHLLSRPRTNCLWFFYNLWCICCE